MECTQQLRRRDQMTRLHLIIPYLLLLVLLFQTNRVSSLSLIYSTNQQETSYSHTASGVYQVDRAKSTHRYETLPDHAEISTEKAEQSSNAYVVVKDLNLKTIRTIDDIVVECYDAVAGDCDYTLSSYEKKMLSLYASIIENVGDDLMDREYSLGLLRDKNSENTMGMYSTNYGGTLHQTAYWIRLKWNDGSKVHDHKSSC